MAKGDHSDLMMKFILNKMPVAGESTTDLISGEGTTNKLLTGFKPGYFIEIDRFTMKAGIHDDEAPAATTQVVNPKDPHAKAPVTLASAAKRGGYQSFRKGLKHPYPVDLQPVSFTRVIDKTSKVLIQSCIDCVSFDSISLIKRKSSGIENAKGETAAGEVFLRIDFIGALITKVDWDNDDKVNETVDFICRSVSINYRPQLPDGTLGRTKPGFWSILPNQTQPDPS